MDRKSGILAPVFSLPSEYGVGDFGSGAYKFVDFLAKSGQKVWQILPLTQTGYGNSPYSSVCSYSFNPYFISPEQLLKKGLVTETETEFCLFKGKYADYGFLYAVRLPLLKKACLRIGNDPDFAEFKRRGRFLDYAIFMTLKYASGHKHFYEWQDKYKFRDPAVLKAFAEDYAEEIEFWQFVQFEAEREWFALKDYANGKGIEIFGDLPLYTALDSVDVWQEPSVYKLKDFVPTTVAGVPPDFFSQTGQLWGNPVYDYEEMRKDGFKWWTERVENALKTFDMVRIDHFRGLDRFYQIPNGAKDARTGEWVKVPSDELFSAIHSKADKNRIVAEDLGIIDDGVRELLKKTGYPGMKVLLFAFNGESGNPYLPYTLPENCVCYTGTHDNDTAMGSLSSASEWDRNNFKNGVDRSILKMGLDLRPHTDAEYVSAVTELGAKSKAGLFILPLQDLLLLGTDMRINEPGTVKPENWSVRFTPEDFSEEASKYLYSLTKASGRI